MKLKEIAAKPKLVEISIDDEDTVKEFGEALTFYTYDRTPMSLFTRMSLLSEKQDIGELINVVKELVLDEEGQHILEGEVTLPVNLLMKVIAKVTDLMGK